jgi:hypothetical protein
LDSSEGADLKENQLVESITGLFIRGENLVRTEGEEIDERFLRDVNPSVELSDLINDLNNSLTTMQVEFFRGAGDRNMIIEPAKKLLKDMKERIELGLTRLAISGPEDTNEEKKTEAREDFPELSLWFQKDKNTFIPLKSKTEFGLTGFPGKFDDVLFTAELERNSRNEALFDSLSRKNLFNRVFYKYAGNLHELRDARLKPEKIVLLFWKDKVADSQTPTASQTV